MEVSESALIVWITASCFGVAGYILGYLLGRKDKPKPVYELKSGEVVHFRDIDMVIRHTSWNAEADAFTVEMQDLKSVERVASLTRRAEVLQQELEEALKRDKEYRRDGR